MEMMTLRTQLAGSPKLQAWMKKKPEEDWGHLTHRWWVYVQKKRGKRWRRVGVKTYKKAYKLLQQFLEEGAYDAALVSRQREFPKPRFLKVPTGHHWCTYCRRFTVFTYFSRHHAFSGVNFDPLPYLRRCSICGVSLAGITRR